MDEINCTGTEKNVTECKHQGWGKGDCGHAEDAGVRCHFPYRQQEQQVGTLTIEFSYICQTVINNCKKFKNSSIHSSIISEQGFAWILLRDYNSSIKS